MNMKNVLSITINFNIFSKKLNLPFNLKEKRYMQAKLWYEQKEIYVRKQNKRKIEWKECSKVAKIVQFRNWKSISLFLMVKSKN